MEMSYFPDLHYFFAFLKARTIICQEMVDISTHLSLFNILISKGGVQDGGD